MQSALQSLDTAIAVSDCRRWRITEITARSRRLLAALGVPLPENIIETVPYEFIPRKYLE